LPRNTVTCPVPLVVGKNTATSIFASLLKSPRMMAFRANDVLRYRVRNACVKGAVAFAYIDNNKKCCARSETSQRQDNSGVELREADSRVCVASTPACIFPPRSPVVQSSVEPQWY